MCRRRQHQQADPDAPTQAELFDALDCTEGEDDGDIFQVHEDNDPSWRHGVRRTTVFKRVSDTTYWQAHYRVSTDGETHELREGDADVSRVYPHEVKAVVYTDAE